MSFPVDYEWELSRENIRPLRGGRNVQSLNNALEGGPASIREAEDKFEKILEDAMVAEDALDVCANYVTWFEERYPTGKQTFLYHVLVRIINTFGNCAKYRNDLRMMKMWFKLADNKPGVSGDIFFERAYTAGCFLTLAPFYIRWAELREASGDISGAHTVFKRAREHNAEPKCEIDEAVDNLTLRQMRLMQEEDAAETDAYFEDTEPQRIVLGGLHCPVITPVFRETFEVARGIVEQPMRKPSSNKCAFEVFQDADSFGDEEPLIPQYFGEDLGRIDFKENKKGPTKWKDARIDVVKKIAPSKDRSFQVFDEEEYKKKKKEKKAREMAMSLLLVADEVNSFEELLASAIECQHFQ